MFRASGVQHAASLCSGVLCPVLVLSCPVLSCPVLSCPVLSCPVLSCPVLSCPVLSCNALPLRVDDTTSPARAQVMGEDLVLVAGQQDRMLRGADVWAHPVAYDKLGVRYRRWRNSLASPDPQARARCALLRAFDTSA